MSLVNDSKVILVSTGATAGTSDVDSDIVDATGYQLVSFIAVLGAVTDDSVLSIEVQDNTVNSGTGMTKIDSTKTTDVTAATSSDKLLITEVYRPVKRYLRAHIERNTQNAVIDSIVAILSNPRGLPTTADATVLAQKYGLGD